MFLSYDDIIRELDGGEDAGLKLSPINRETQIGPASVILRLSGNGVGLFDELDIAFGDDSQADGVLSREGFAQALTIEELRLPSNMIAFLSTPSKLARQGINVTQGSQTVEPGFHGRIQLEITNFGPRSINVRPGIGIVSISFAYLKTPTSKPYRGSFYKQGIPLAKGGIEGREGVIVPKWGNDPRIHVLK